MTLKLVSGGEKRDFKLTVLAQEQMDKNLLKICWKLHYCIKGVRFWNSHPVAVVGTTPSDQNNNNKISFKKDFDHSIK